nr:hypothetical protein [Tanacetum cinerariifolium]
MMFLISLAWIQGSISWNGNDDVIDILGLDSRFNVKKVSCRLKYRYGISVVGKIELFVLGLVVQYGVSNLWIWRIKGLRWIRRIHSMDTTYPSLQFLVSFVSVIKTKPYGVRRRATWCFEDD